MSSLTTTTTTTTTSNQIISGTTPNRDDEEERNNNVIQQQRRTSSRKASYSSSSSSPTAAAAVTNNNIKKNNRRESSSSYFSKPGRDFYDDGYYSNTNTNNESDVEDDNDDSTVTSIEDRLDFSTIAQHLKQRQETKLQVLHTIYRHIIAEGQEEEDDDDDDDATNNGGGSTSSCGANTTNTKKTDNATNTYHPPPKHAHAAMIHGASGTGKSTLVHQFVNELLEEDDDEEEEEDIEQQQGREGRTKKQQKRPKTKNKPHFIVGKYDELSGGDPFSAIVEAFAGFAENLLHSKQDDGDYNSSNNDSDQHNDDTINDKEEGKRKAGKEIILHDNEELERIRNEIQRVLGREEAHILATVIPSLRPILFSSSSNNNNKSGGSHGNAPGDGSGRGSGGGVQNTTTATTAVGRRIPTTIYNNSWNRLKYIFQIFVNAICTPQRRPLIMFLDDLQWCDSASLELLQLLLTDMDLKYFMFIGAYRTSSSSSSASSSTSSPPPVVVQQQEDENEGGSSNLLTCLEVIDMILQEEVAYIELVNLTQEELYEFVTHVLKKSDNEENINNDDDHDDDDDHLDEAATTPETREILNEEEGGEAVKKDNNNRHNPDQDHTIGTRRENDDEFKVLVEVLHRKTGGNIFFAMQVLEELQRKGILLFSRVTFEWECNVLSTTNLEDLLSDNVLSAVTSKITSSPKLVQRALIITAYTRSTIDIGTLQTLLDLDGHPIGLDELEKLLDKAVLDGLFSNSMGSKSYSFSHDRIQQASYEMIPAGPIRDTLRLDMGRRLYERGMSKIHGEDWMLFAAAEHLNATATFMQLQQQQHQEEEHKQQLDDPLFLTKINLQVGERALSIAAYEIASKFLGFGMHSLLHSVKDPWKNHYDITLQLFQAVATVELCQGHFENGQEIGNRILQHAKTAEDKLPTHVCLARALGQEREHRKSFELCAAALRELRVYPLGSLGMNLGLIRDMVLVKNYFKKHSNEDILSLPMAKDATKATVVELLNILGFQAYMCGKTVAFLASTLMQLRITIKYGICPYSANAIMSYCLVCDSMNDMKSVYRLQSLARQLLDLTKAKELETLQLFLSAYFFSSWREPHNDVIAIYHRAGKSGMESGEFETGLMNIMTSYYYEFLAGFSLEQLDSKYSNLRDKMKMYRVESMDVFAVQQWLLVQHLVGSSKTPLDFDELEQFGFTKTDGSENSKVLYGYMTRVQLGVYFGNFPFARRMMELLEQTDSIDTSYAVKNVQLFFGSLIYATLARDNNKKIYLKQARKFSRELKLLCKIKGDKCWHRYLLAEAHQEACGGGKSGDSIQTSYDDAISAAMQSGHNQDAALGFHLAAEYVMSKKQSRDTHHHTAMSKAQDILIQQYLTRARDMYQNWGALGMVKHLEKKHSNYISSVSATLDKSPMIVYQHGSNANSMDEGLEQEIY